MQIFLTGGAGLVGGDLAATLLQRGHQVTALVHRNNTIRDAGGMAIADARLHLVSGDIRLGDFGRGQDWCDDIARTHDMIVHCAAVTDFTASEATYRAVNINGTAHVAALARQGDIPLLHVSTAYVCGMRDGHIAEAPVVENTRFANGYEASKAAAEAIVRASGVAAAIARPSIVVGRSHDGAIAKFDTIYAAFRLMAEGAISMLPVAPNAALDLVPVDHVTTSLIAIAERLPELTGQTFHIIGERPTPIAALMDVVSARGGLARPKLCPHDIFSLNLLPNRERRLHQRAFGPYASYFQRFPRFDDTSLRQLGVIPPRWDVVLLDRLIGYCLDAGFIRPEFAKRNLAAQRISG